MGKGKRVIVYLEEPPEFLPKHGLFRITIDGIAEYAISPHNLMLTIEKATKAYREWIAEDHEAKPIRKK